MGRLEKVAVSPPTYECRLVPGMLQSAEGARAVKDVTHPDLAVEREGWARSVGFAAEA